MPKPNLPTQLTLRLYLLPISTRRTLLYCHKTDPSHLHPAKTSYLDQLTHKAARIWAGWEKKEGGWQRMTVDYGNKLLRRIPYEEWGLKSIPPLSSRRRAEELAGQVVEEGTSGLENKKGDDDEADGGKKSGEGVKDKEMAEAPSMGKAMVELIFPPNLIEPENARGVLHRLGTEREGLHWSRLKWCFVGMPITAPIGILPVIPNLPFFYLAYRAWSHWRALKGGEHIQFLVKHDLLTPVPSLLLDAVYVPPKPEKPTIASPVATVLPPNPDELGINGEPEDPRAEKMLLTQKNGQKLAQDLDLPELEIELERAIWQVENAIREKKQWVEAGEKGQTQKDVDGQGEGTAGNVGKRR